MQKIKLKYKQDQKRLSKNLFSRLVKRNDNKKNNNVKMKVNLLPSNSFGLMCSLQVGVLDNGGDDGLP